MTECGPKHVAALSQIGIDQHQQVTECAPIALAEDLHSVIAPIEQGLIAAFRTPLGVLTQSVSEGSALTLTNNPAMIQETEAASRTQYTDSSEWSCT